MRLNKTGLLLAIASAFVLATAGSTGSSGRFKTVGVDFPRAKVLTCSAGDYVNSRSVLLSGYIRL